MLQGKTILLGISGGIAAYKAATICSRLVQAGAKVRVIMTESATKFIAPLTLQTLSRHPVYLDTFDEFDPSVVAHIDAADSADLVLVAPATANIVGKMANGLADDFLSTTLLAATAPVIVAPAMNVHMYAHPAVERNMALLADRGVRFVEPGTGLLACGYVGKGRLAEPEEIVAAVKHWFASRTELAGKSVLVTAGGTAERLDPVRFLTNDSSGKMGFALAEAAANRGADVTLIAARTTAPPIVGVKLVRVESAEQMLQAVLERYDAADIVIKAAAVADYRPVSQAPTKIKKSEEKLVLELERTTDILKTLGERKTHQFLVGFAAETEQVAQYAMDKLRRKNCDLVVANDVSQDGAGFNLDTNVVQIFGKDGLIEALPQLHKREVADHLLERIVRQMQKKPAGEAGE
ncbi:bifunctional phosphopantothenoylcysteine decarboxylase/phosphopantothenate--cysteine ligase CoaBC [Paenibacillus sacheonensis]|uniref:Coenzyme A biosynthesis bifunctional protein CoaBC n=1 Tax=Paenibacillus sacheonensis TaxID=742054 RepID=A0A7X5C2E2_9BACL|nr:bifunctional phosphopantothenoylcysteine decarboxylase/phosphopantothenate--cysteine ligase CoaBC [Paenibacillus sacheonensis]MBM7563511.1 phosphopantothenoylcysteine decarboxylase/phosphopantothenate--cysteine ligase [Paenibacillus sacheonensis]NBC71190.1 bifunctional phosphopantothenoylcysteine decarboxylase/phosphopantothenate--cysteine ligase CoaBC [Paenibacillus sacheonensis]